MRRLYCVLALAGLAMPTSARADGMLVPTDRSLPPLSLSHQRVHVSIEGQVATTAVEQVYRNGTGRDLEADYLFPLPGGATVREFAMWVNGRRISGETIEAGKARRTYEDIVRRLKDPGLLEFVDRDLWKVRIFPVPAHGDQKIEIKYSAVLPREGDLVSYRYPLRTGQAARQTTGDFTMVVRLHGPDPLGPVYSPSHDAAVDRRGEREAVVSFERSRYTLDRDFQLYFAPRSKDVGLSLLAHRESPSEPGYFLLLLSPPAEDDAEPPPRDLVVVLDTSHSMKGEKIEQAKGALRAALDSLGPDDRFSLIRFATVVDPFRDSLRKANRDNLAEARAWVDKIEAQGATDIGSALDEALGLRPDDRDGRTFQVVFFTDGLPTAGRDSSEILKAVEGRDLEGIRIFTFGVGDDVDAHLLDQLAESTRAASTYVRPAEDLEAKASTLVARISHPVRTGLKLRSGDGVRLREIYPPHLPDLFRGDQLQVAGRYEGSGHVALTLESRVGGRERSDTFEVRFPESETDHDFVAPIWAGRKIGYLLDQIRLRGESGELKEEVIRLAREFGIATPYTSLLVVPDERPGFAREGRSPSPSPRRLYEDLGRSAIPGTAGPGSVGAKALGPDAAQPGNYGYFRRERQSTSRGPSAATPSLTPGQQRHEFDAGASSGRDFGEDPRTSPSEPAADATSTSGDAQPGPAPAVAGTPVSGARAIDLAQVLAKMKTQGQVDAEAAVRIVGGRRFRLVEGTWVDDRFGPDVPSVVIRPFGSAYFRLLERHPELKDVFALGQDVIWVGPSGKALIVGEDGAETLPDADLEALFAPASE